MPAPPPSAVAACGALGQFDRDRVLAMARTHDCEPRVVHESSDSILLLDREPIRWRGDDTSGCAWEEQLGGIRPDARSYQEVATGGCGLAVSPDGPLVHSSVAGVGPLFYLTDGEATYFSTRVHPLAVTHTERLSIDWDTWASILTLHNAIGDGTPFAEIRFLEPSSTLRHARGNAQVSADPWPWAEVEARYGLDEGADAVVAAWRTRFAHIPDPVIVPLSGGLDSRLCLGLLMERKRPGLRTITADEGLGHDADLLVAAELSARYGVPHESILGEEGDYPGQFKARASALDYQFVRQPWRATILDSIRRSGAILVDGFGFDTLATPGDRYLTAAACEPHGRDSVVEALWDALAVKRARPGSIGLKPALSEAMWERAHARLMAASRPFSGHPARAMLTLYRSREVRGVAVQGHIVLGGAAPLAMPLIDDAAARATLAIPVANKRGGKLYDAVLERLSPVLREVPIPRREDVEGASPLPRRSQTRSAAEAIASFIADGPLTPFVLPRKRTTLRRHHEGEPVRVPPALTAASYLHLWHQRYRDVLREVDARDAL